MTEEEWLAATRPGSMWDTLDNLGSERKLRLFSVACCRSILHLLNKPAILNAVETADRHAAGLATDEELFLAAKEANNPELLPPQSYDRAISIARLSTFSPRFQHIYTDPPTGRYDPDCFAQRSGFASIVSSNTAYAVAEQKHHPATQLFGPAFDSAFEWQASVLKDIFGNPFRPVAVDSCWLTSTVVALAEGIYEDRAFDRMPVLADALQDAGCENEDILNHCRQPGEHVRGCWVVDLLTGRK